ncbi:hypothetical protein KBX08_01425 [Micromonospora sp. H61]|uniref:hypothetical protein n=1 Tax=Micromonospora sp. H61 TaxID=2824888 RepID=UPI001B38793E|nr:hypothetical protein [Micromonospora sp. H61]MBQ0988754.1 hypothetical protein [Micromonospora sp. H61]
MTDLPRVGVLHAPRSAAGLGDIERAAGSRCRPVILIDARDAREHPASVRAAATRFPVAVATSDSLPQIVARLDLRGVTTFHDARLEQADRIARQLGAPRMTIEGCWDRLAVRTTLARHGLSAIASQPVDTPDDLRRIVAASSGVRVLRSRQHQAAGRASLIADAADVQREIARRRRWSGLLLETRPSPLGRQVAAGCVASISVLTVNEHRAHHHLGLWDNIATGAPFGVDSRLAATVTRPTRLPEHQRTVLTRFVSRCLDVLGVRWRVAHTELALTPQGIEVLDVDVCPGARLTRHLGCSGADLVADALTLAIGAWPVAREVDGRYARPGCRRESRPMAIRMHQGVG